LKRNTDTNRIIEGINRGEAFEFSFDGETVTAYPGETIAVALLAAGKRALRITKKMNEPRGYYCGMGVCWGCTVIVDGRPNVRACVIQAKPGMQVKTQYGPGQESSDE
jgi:aerobic-type carbon monoxide dehydrogenase small subunit (CoxS/CutS family)